jgi:lactate racemase
VVAIESNVRKKGEAPPLPDRDAPALTIPWGRESLKLEPPSEAGWPPPRVFAPDLSGLIDDYPAALQQALAAPEGCGPIEEQARPGSKVAIVVDDPTRWTPVREALPVVLARLHAIGISAEDIRISVGVGRHHAVDDAAMRLRLGDPIAERYACFSPPVDDLSSYSDLGTTPRGVPVRVFRPVAEASLRILIGSVLPHLQAGFGGGYKLIFPGASHRSTLGALHRQGIGRHDDPARLLGGPAATNPMRQAIHEAAALLGPCLSISHLMGAPGQILRVRSGRPDVVQDALASEAKQRFQAPPGPPADLVVVGNHPWPGDPLMSFKVLLQHRSACRPGGVLAGFFWTDPNEIDRSLPRSTLRAIAAAGAPGAWLLRKGLTTADRLAAITQSPAGFMIHWARELVVDRTVLVYAPPLYDRVGPRLGPVRLFNDQAALWRAARQALSNIRSTNVCIFPQGGLTYTQTSP